MSNPREGLARSVQQRLARHAKAIGADPNFVLTRYGVERFLYRLSKSAYAERFVLKGALLLLVWLGETLRPTRDADLLGVGDLPDTTLLQIFREICAMEVEPDAVKFLSESVVITPIREQDAYGGRRINLQARLGAAVLVIQVDIGIGDAITPAPQWLEYPTLLNAPRPKLRAYPRETVIAEKLHAMALLGMRNSRMKDYFDVYALIREQTADPETLACAIAATFARRQTKLPDGVMTGLSESFAADTQKQTQWRAFAARNRITVPSLESSLPTFALA